MPCLITGLKIPNWKSKGFTCFSFMLRTVICGPVQPCQYCLSAPLLWKPLEAASVPIFPVGKSALGGI